MFPEIIYGTCSICGGRAADDPDASGADVSARDTTGDGVILVYHEGQLMCEMCKQNRINRDESLLSNEKHAEAEQFRQKAGFKKTI